MSHDNTESIENSEWKEKRLTSALSSIDHDTDTIDALVDDNNADDTLSDGTLCKSYSEDQGRVANKDFRNSLEDICATDNPEGHQSAPPLHKMTLSGTSSRSLNSSSSEESLQERVDQLQQKEYRIQVPRLASNDQFNSLSSLSGDPVLSARGRISLRLKYLKECATNNKEDIGLVQDNEEQGSWLFIILNISY